MRKSEMIFCDKCGSDITRQMEDDYFGFIRSDLLHLISHHEELKNDVCIKSLLNFIGIKDAG